MGNFLIKQVAKRLQQDLPHVQIYSTLSPIPKFMEWLRSKVSHHDLPSLCMQGLDEWKSPEDGGVLGKTLLRLLQSKTWYHDPKITTLLEPIVTRLAIHYLYSEKKRGKALCPVANFHIRNGAIFERLNWLADPSPKGLSQSAGLMVNYKYDLTQVEKNNEQYVLHDVIAIGESVRQMIMPTHNTK